MPPVQPNIEEAWLCHLQFEGDKSHGEIVMVQAETFRFAGNAIKGRKHEMSMLVMKTAGCGGKSWTSPQSVCRPLTPIQTLQVVCLDVSHRL